MVEGALQIPRTGLKICLWVEELVDLEVVDLVFTRPFIRGFLTDLHQAALAHGSVFLTIKPALAPDDSFDQHWIELMLGRDRQNEFVVLLKSSRTDPFIKTVECIAGPKREITEPGRQSDQQTQNQF